MTDQELKSWLEEAIHGTAPFGILSGDEGLDDTFGWGARFEKMWNGQILTPDSHGLILTGPDGCGKHTAAAHMFHTLITTHNALLLDGRDLCAGGYIAATHRLRYALDHLSDGYPWCLILEGLEDCEFRRELFSWLGQALSFEWFTETGNSPPFLILIDALVEDIPSVLRRHLRLCRMALPGAGRRRSYFFRAFPHSFNIDILVKSTDGLTYAQMVDLARNLECARDPQYPMSNEELQEFLQEQYPVPAVPDDPLKSLAQSARLFVEQLPELMTHMGTAVGTETIVKEIVKAPKEEEGNGGQIKDPPPEQSEEAQMAAYRKQVEEMSGSELATDLFGEDVMADLEQYRPHA